MAVPGKIALLTINEWGEQTAEHITRKDPGITVFKHSGSSPLAQLVASLFRDYTGIVFCCATGIAVRLIAPFIKSKYTDPAVVVVDNGGRYALSLLSGHEGGANALAYYIAGLTGTDPVITTATEARKSFVLGIGCVRGITVETVIQTIRETLSGAGIPLRGVRAAATITAKYDEAGLREGLQALSIPLQRIEEARIAAFSGAFRKTAAARYFSIPAVAEPCALLAAREGELVVPLRKENGMTMAVARERIGPV